MSKYSIVALMCAMACGGSEPRAADAGSAAPQEFNLGSIAPTPPEDLLALADYVRGGGGRVFVGTVGPSAEAGPELVEVHEGLWVSYPRRRATVTVGDTLGEEMPESIELLAPSGEVPELVDAAGRPAEGWTVSGDWQVEPQRLLEPEGEAVCFVIGANLIWRADVLATGASGVGTASGVDMPFDDLRRPE